MRNCAECDKSSPDCSWCLDNPENAVPVKLYSPKGAVRAMLAGKFLKDMEGSRCFWDCEFSQFRYRDKHNEAGILTEFSGLYEEMA
ncbi:MAG: hypothetical protein FWH41_09695 [Treponema sp.]|nr:hypothetical protein [Treponema sp.]